MRIEHIRARLQACGAKTCHEDRVLRAWTQVVGLDTRHRKAESFLPLAVRNALPALFADLDGLARLRALVPGVPLAPVAGDDLAERLGLRHYPVLITATGIEQ